MFSKIVGIIWIILGGLWALKPQILKNRLKKKMTRKIKWIVYGFIIVFGLILLGSVIKAPGAVAKIAGFIGIIIAIRVMVLLTTKTSEKAINWWAEKPLIVFRIWGLVIFVIGVMLILA
ncbi:MAG: hypothetical protein HQ579_07340 [Candidatus Omnitrophica bacterium]|nr:hypothetical protein [Candidatus Omnitrophota bacterium]